MANTKNKKKQTPPKSRHLREFGALICLLLAIFAGIGLVGLQGIVLNWFADSMKYLVGWGVFVLPFSLLGASMLLFFHGGQPVRMRLTALLFLPLLLGILLHLILFRNSAAAFGALGQQGMTLDSGGALGGIIANLLAVLLNRIFSVVIVALLLATAVLYLLRVSPAAIITALRGDNRKKRERQPKPERLPPEPKPPKLPKAEKRNLNLPKTSMPEKRKLNLPKTGIAVEVPIEPEPEIEIEAVSFTDSDEDILIPAASPIVDLDSNFGAKTSKYTPPCKSPQTNMLPSSEEEVLPADNVDFVVHDYEPNPQDKPLKTEKLPATLAGDVAEEYTFPPMTHLTAGKPMSQTEGKRELEHTANRLMETLGSFNINCRITNVTRGPSVTRYEMELHQGIKLSKLTALSGDIALALGASSVRIAPIVNRMSTVGIEVPNKTVHIVHIRDVLDSDDFASNGSPTTFALGKDISGKNIVSDIAKMPHLLIAGTTGSGKSVCMNTLIVSLLFKSSPEDLRLIMIDPKMVEFDVYNGIPHLLIPVVTDPKKAAGALQWAVVEMEKRYRMFQERGVRDIMSYNQSLAKDRDSQEPKMPRIVILIDELADLMVVARKEVEESIIRVAQKARAAGMYLVVATQRPSADVITGLMKANLPSRIAFAVASQIESRIVLDTTGAEDLVGRGDMLYSPLGEAKPMRVQGCLITTKEVEDVVKFVKKNNATEYNEETIAEIAKIAEKANPATEGQDFDASANEDPMFYDALQLAVNNSKISTTSLQTRLKLGYARAARVMVQLEDRGFIGPPDGAKPREILITREEYEEMMMRRE
ncbi:MAG: DNA translocase FtsK [Oscillospiraceae bacterium]|nr:DNA translocase FtsK [Oscillospiraceae bacterium]